MTTLFISGTPDEATVAQLANAGFKLTDVSSEADGIVTMPGTPARTVRGWLTQADHDRHMGYMTGGRG